MFYTWDNLDLLLNIRVQPKASNTGFAEELGDEIKFRLTSPPQDGKANRQLVTTLAKIFTVSRSAITIVSGEHSRHKRVRICHPKTLPEGILAPPAQT